ncbi:MAG TPA: hypothetical protein VKM72_25895 [Thermoanaerobaculia bacterium]|nr:hypothetical protein [Thermoanaerobaculia bacterium]
MSPETSWRPPATRRVNVAGLVPTLSREPIYLRAAELPSQLVDDPYLRNAAVSYFEPQWKPQKWHRRRYPQEVWK